MKVAHIVAVAIMAGWTMMAAAQVVSSPQGVGGGAVGGAAQRGPGGAGAPGVVGGIPGAGGAQRGRGQGRGDAPAAPLTLEATLTLGKTAYSIPADQNGEAFRNRIRAASARGGTMPAPPEVDMTLELKNTGSAPVTIMVEADSATVNLNLEGPGAGAVNTDANVAMTMEFRMGRSLTIDPGKSFSIPIKSLRHGVRGISKVAYWTEPGEYTLTASYTTHPPDQGDRLSTIAAPSARIQVTVAGKP